MHSRFVSLVLSGCGLLFLAGCGSTPPPRLRTPPEIQDARDRLPVLYLTAKTHKEVVRPKIRSQNLQDLVDKETNELMWEALVCTNPACPGKSKATADRPYIFINPDPMFDVNPDGTIKPPDATIVGQQYELERERRGGFSEPTCPECKKNRPKTETAAEHARYVNFVKEYVLPETANRNKELDEELKKWNEYLAERRGRKANKDEP